MDSLKEYNQSEEIERFANKAIATSHEHLVGAHIAYLQKTAKRDAKGNIEMPKQKREGKAVKIASACLVPATYQELTGFDFMIVVKEEFWLFFTDEQKLALIDHELCHCLQDEDGYYTGGHSLEEFSAIIERHGAWKADVRRFFDAVQGRFKFNDLLPVGSEKQRASKHIQ